jgi:hypothetical protein
MHWFRSNICLGSRLALFALAAQMQLSFGHVHLPTGALSSAPSMLTDGSSASCTNGPVNKSKGSIDHYCPICALIQLLTTATPPGVPALPLPRNLAETALQAPAKLAFALSPHFSFQARAPPLN